MNASTITQKSIASRKKAAAKSEREKAQPPDSVLQQLENAKLPLTRENYLATVYPLGLPDNWGPGHEATLPKELRRIII